MAAIASGLVTSFLNDESWKAQRHQRLRGTAHQPGRRGVIGPGPSPARPSSGRSGATSGTSVTSTGTPTDGHRGDRQVGPVGGGEQREDAAEAPADDVHRPAAGVPADASRIAVGTTSSTQCSMPRLRSRERHLAVLHEVGRPPGVDEVLDQRAAAAQVEAERRRGERRHQQHRVAVLLDLRRGR